MGLLIMLELKLNQVINSLTHICISKLISIGSDNGLSPDRRQAMIWTNVGILLIRPLGTNFSEILIEIHTVSFRKMHLKMSSGIWRPFCYGFNVLYGAPCLSELSKRFDISWDIKRPSWILSSGWVGGGLGVGVGGWWGVKNRVYISSWI